PPPASRKSPGFRAPTSSTPAAQTTRGQPRSTLRLWLLSFGIVQIIPLVRHVVCPAFRHVTVDGSEPARCAASDFPLAPRGWLPGRKSIPATTGPANT